MAQFDVYKAPRGGDHSLLVDVQTDFLSSMESRVVVPLIARKKLNPKERLARLNPMCEIDGIEYVLITQELAAIPTSVLGKRVATLAPHRDEIVSAIDMLITGI
jgi:toxin CcdB